MILTIAFETISPSTWTFDCLCDEIISLADIDTVWSWTPFQLFVLVRIYSAHFLVVFVDFFLAILFDGFDIWRVRDHHIAAFIWAWPEEIILGTINVEVYIFFETVSADVVITFHEFKLVSAVSIKADITCELITRNIILNFIGLETSFLCELVFVSEPFRLC